MLNEILKSLREQNRYSQTTLADYLHITRQAYNHYETGKRIPPLETIKKLADFYGVSTDVFLSPEKDINKLTESKSFETTNETNNIGLKRLIEKRKELNLSQAELAEKLGVSQQTISKYENGSREPDNNTLLKLSELFKVSIDYLLENPQKYLDSTTNSSLDNQPLSVDEGALLLQKKLKGTPLVNEQDVITKEGADIFATFLINNADMLKKLLNDNK